VWQRTCVRCRSGHKESLECRDSRRRVNRSALSRAHRCVHPRVNIECLPKYVFQPALKIVASAGAIRRGSLKGRAGLPPRCFSSVARRTRGRTDAGSIARRMIRKDLSISGLGGEGRGVFSPQRKISERSSQLTVNCTCFRVASDFESVRAFLTVKLSAGRIRRIGRISQGSDRARRRRSARSFGREASSVIG